MTTDLDTDVLVRSARRFDRARFDAELLAVIARVAGPAGPIAP
jgi:hypothetical protein